MVAPLRRRSGRKSSQVRNIFWICEHENCGQRNIRKHKEIKCSDKCFTLNIYEILNISEKFDDLNKMEITSSESKVELEGSGKGLVTALDLKTKARSKNIRWQGMQSEISVWRKFPTLSKSLKIVKVPYFKRIPKHEPTSSYFHLVGCLGEFNIRCGENNHHVHDGYEK